MAKNTDGQVSFEQQQQFEAMMRRRESQLMRNHVELAGVVSEIEQMPMSEKKDRDGRVINDEDGKPTFWDPMYKVTVRCFGSEEHLYLDVTLAQTLEKNRAYLFTGRIKDRKFKAVNAGLI